MNRLVAVFTFGVCLILCACGSESSSRQVNESTGTPAQASTPSRSTADEEARARERSRLVSFHRESWARVQQPVDDWTVVVENKSSCVLIDRYQRTLELYNDLELEGTPGRPVFSPKITAEELGVDRGKLRELYRSFSLEVAKLWRDVSDGKMVPCFAIGEGGHVYLDRLKSTEQMVTILRQAGLNPSDMGLTALQVRSMIREGIQEHLNLWRQGKRVDEVGSLSFTIREYGFEPKDLGITPDEWQKIQ